MDGWNQNLFDKFKSRGGNKVVNSIYEARLPSSMKPKPSTDVYDLEKFIRDKYEHRKWYSEKKAKKWEKQRKKDEESDSDSGSETGSSSSGTESSSGSSDSESSSDSDSSDSRVKLLF